jgi:hypothetical protein
MTKNIDIVTSFKAKGSLRGYQDKWMPMLYEKVLSNKKQVMTVMLNKDLKFSIMYKTILDWHSQPY